MRKEFKGAGWIAEAMLKSLQGPDLPRPDDADRHAELASGTRGVARRRLRVSHAAGRPGLAYGDGGRLRIGRELPRHGENFAGAFAAYEAKIKPEVIRRQRDARFARIFIPSRRSRPWLRRLVIKAMFSPLLLPLVFRWFGARSVLEGYT